MYSLKKKNKAGSFPVGSVVKNLPSNSWAVGLIPGSGRSPGEGNGNSLQYSSLGNPIDKGAWWTAVHGVTRSQTRLMTGLSCTLVTIWHNWILCIFLERICKKKEINEIYMYWHYVSQAHRIGFERYIVFLFLRGFPHGDSDEEPTCQYRRCRDAGSIPGSGMIEL